MPKPGELSALSAELKDLLKPNPCPFSYEWSSPAQGRHLLLCGDWNRQGRRTSRTIQDAEGHPFKKASRQLTTEQRLRALEAAASLVRAYLEGSTAKQRKKRLVEPSSSLLGRQKSQLISMIRQRDGGYGVKTKHLRHARNLFDWLDQRNCLLDSVNAISWAGDAVKRNTDNYSDRIRVAQWACSLNNIPWVLPANKRPLAPQVRRPFVDLMAGRDLSGLFPLIKDEEAAHCFRVVAATGCRPSEIFSFDWREWEMGGRQNTVTGYSRKKGENFTAIVNPLHWLDGLKIELLAPNWDAEQLRSRNEQISSEITRRSSRLLKLIQRDLREAGLEFIPTWTCLRHLWTIRAELDGVNRRIGALAQAHSEKMASLVYLRHGSTAQVLAEAKRIASIPTVAC